MKATNHSVFESPFKSQVLGHPSALYVLFFTEMWERFSYYGMRALLVMFFTASLLEGGWGWSRELAMAIFGSYVGLVYLSTVLGGYFADQKIGYQRAVLVGALLMALGHGSMALETPWCIYTGLGLLVFGSGFFKPNMTSIISEMYKEYPEKKDGAFTIFYMGVNAGAFFGILMCGYLGEKVGWNVGFGLAGIFMLLGLIQFWLSREIFGGIGRKPQTKNNKALETPKNQACSINPFSKWQLTLIGITSSMGLAWLLFEPIALITEGRINLFDFEIIGLQGNNFTILLALFLFVFLLVYRIHQYDRVTKEKMMAVSFFAFLTIFFWAIFEQSPGTLTLFARDYTDRVLEGNARLIFLVIDALMTFVPLVIVSWVLWLLFKETLKKYAAANLILALSFVVLWGIALWKLTRDIYAAGYLHLSDNTLRFLNIEKTTESLTEIQASWFSILNALFIISLAPLFSKWWESKYNPSANKKFALGMFLLGLGMACVAIGANGIEPGAKSASVSMVWLFLVYLFHTLGELCISPLGLSYVSKLVPPRMIAFMFGIWYLAIAVGMKGAGKFGENMDKIADQNGISFFFWILTLVSLVMGGIAIAFEPIIKKYMHGVR